MPTSLPLSTSYKRALVLGRGLEQTQSNEPLSMCSKQESTELRTVNHFKETFLRDGITAYLAHTLVL